MAYLSTMFPHPLLVRAVATALQSIFQEGRHADKVIEFTLRQNPKAGSRDRAFIAETTYEIVRHYRRYVVLLGREPKTEDDFWALAAIHLVLTGNPLPDWRETQGLNVQTLKAENEKLQADRRLRESLPDWLDERASAEITDKWEETAAWLNRPAQVVLRTNTLKTNRLALQKILLQQGIETNFFGQGDALVLARRQNVFQTPAFKQGLFEVQDFSSQQVAPALDVAPGMRVVDACAGGGGKTLHLASLMQNRGQIIALDTLSWKLDELRLRARRAGAANIETRPIENRKTIKRLYGTADRLLLDVPCSGLGVIRRNPDSKWKLSAAGIDQLRETQQEILQSYSEMVKPGGKMVYATCSILPSENEKQVEAFLASEAGKNFAFIRDQKILPQDKGFDGFYISVLEKSQ